MKKEFIVNENVFIPSPETEILVKEVIDILKSQKNKLRVLDLCTGSGVIALSIAEKLNNVQILATDISEKALEVARQNLVLLSNKKHLNVEFIQSNLFENIQGKFDLIVSNPPYGETAKIKRLDLYEAWKQYEPTIARDGGSDGLDFYRKIVSEADKYLNPEGYLCLEIGKNKKEKVVNLIKDAATYDNIYSKKDLEGNDKIIICNRISIRNRRKLL